MTVLSLRIEPMGPHFTKWHIDGLPCAAVLHRFSAPDHGPPHDHPWSFTSTILHGGYVEEIYEVENGLIETVTRCPGDTFFVPDNRIHRIIDLPEGECWTLIQPQGPQCRTSGFYEFRDDGTYHRFWHEPEFKRLRP